MLITIVIVLYVIVGAILGTLYHAFLEKTDKSYDFEDEGAKAVAMAVFWPLGAIIFITYHSYKNR